MGGAGRLSGDVVREGDCADTMTSTRPKCLYPIPSNGGTMESLKAAIVYSGHINFENKILICLR